MKIINIFVSTLMLMLLVMSGSAIAAWSKITVNEEAIIYADVSSIKKSGDMVKMWDITDFKKKNVIDKYLSTVSLHEYDCKQKKSRVLSYSMYSGNMGTGGLVSSSSHVHDWLPVKSGGVVEALFANACRKN